MMTMKPIHAGRFERYLGAEKVSHLQRQMRGWYGRPICLIDVPGSVWITADGDFVGTFKHGWYMGGFETLVEFWRRMGRIEHGVTAAGFASVSSALARATGGYSQRRSFYKLGPTGVATVSSSLWRVGATPSAGAAGSAAPGGRACDNTTAGAMPFANPADGTNRLVGADATGSLINQTVLFYDRLFDVAKTMASTATEAVTGVPTRYQSTTNTAEEYAGDNFLFVEVGGTQLAATAHNWTVCQYTNQAGTTGQSMPSMAGNSAAIVDRLDHPIYQWFAPLVAGDLGIKALTQMQCSASVATGVINFVIGHPLGFMSFPIVSTFFPFDWITNRDQAPLIVNGACGAFMQSVAASATATTYNGRIYVTAAP